MKDQRIADTRTSSSLDDAHSIIVDLSASERPGAQACWRKTDNEFYAGHVKLMWPDTGITER